MAHNNKAGKNLVFCVDTTARASSCKDDVARWLVATVNQTYPVNVGSYPHSLVIGTWCDNFVEQADDGSPTGHVINRLLAVAHAEQDAKTADSLFRGLVIPTEIHPPIMLNAAVVAATLVSRPAPCSGVCAVGVSAVSDKVAAELWGEIVSTDRDFMANLLREHPTQRQSPGRRKISGQS